MREAVLSLCGGNGQSVHCTYRHSAVTQIGSQTIKHFVLKIAHADPETILERERERYSVPQIIE
jgi:hypothetical protein